MPSPDKHETEPTFKIVTTASNEIEAAMIAGCLENAGIRCVYGQTLRSAYRPSDIYVAEADLERAREVLNAASDADDPAPEPTQTIPAKDGDIEIPVPSRKDFLSVVERVAGRALRKRPDETGQPPGRSD
ncbi:MAG: putative signal transducing protein [Solirubrobacteraceae bacterium]